MIQFLFSFVRSFFLGRGRFLVLFQNNQELRASGGFITAVADIGLLQIRLRKVFGELDQHKPVKGPKPLQEMLQDGYFKSWTLRDANYFPNFSKTSAEVIRFYKKIFPKAKVDSVAAMNFSFVEQWLRRLGPIQIKGHVMNADNLFYFLSAEVSDIDRHNLESLAGRKAILKVLAKSLLLASLLRFWIWPQLFFLIHRSFRNRDIQLNRPAGPPEFSFEKDQHFFAIIESNFLGLKSNRYLQRSVTHDSQMTAEGSFRNEVRIIWEHFGAYDRPLSGIYKAYIRLVVPKASKNIQWVSSLPLQNCDQHDEGEFLVIGFKLFLKPQEKCFFHLQYRSPRGGSPEQYQFKYFKQSGVIRENFQKSVIFPQGTMIVRPSKGLVTEQVYTYGVAQVDQDVVIDLLTMRTKNAPRLLRHELIRPNMIRLDFSEPILLEKKKNNFLLKERDGKKHFELKKVFLNEDGKSLFFEVRKLPSKEEVFYTLTLKNLKSAQGVFINPNPRTVTVVYRSRFFTPEKMEG